jgi:hypothetical protein
MSPHRVTFSFGSNVTACAAFCLRLFSLLFPFVRAGKIRQTVKELSTYKGCIFMVRTAFALITAFCLSLSPVAAATVTTTIVDLTDLKATSLDLPVGSTWLLPPDTVNGDAAGEYLSPFFALGAGNYEETSYWNVAGSGGSGNMAQLIMGTVSDSLSLLWGSPDTYNFVTLINFVRGGLTTSVSIGLNDLNQGLVTPGGGAVYVTISGFLFNKVEFFSSSPAFEFSNVSASPAPVPLPAAGLMLLIALGGLAALRQHKSVV